VTSALALALLLHAAPPLMLNHTAEIMTTRLQVRVVLNKESEREPAKQAIAAVEVELRRLEGLLSEWKPGAPFARLNDTAIQPHRLLSEVQDILVRALKWAERTGGAFDPTFASLWGLWRFHKDEVPKIPTAQDALARAQLIDYHAVHLDPDTGQVRLLKPGMKLGLGGIAKGYAVDCAVRLLRARGFSNFFIKLGGELYLAGTRGDRPWVAGVQDPRDPTRHFAALALQNSAFTTSGDYQRFLMVDGIRYHHIIDPETGYPARKCRSVTIIAKKAEDADALSTGVFVMGPRRGMALIERTEGVEAIIVDAQGAVQISSGLRGKVHFTAHPRDAEQPSR